MAASIHTALGQALGYVYQFDRATIRLLEAADSVVSVAIEHIDDVSVHHRDGTVEREQDKAIFSGRASLSDLSTALWKTLAIWCEELGSEGPLLARTELHLVTNGSVNPTGLARRMSDARSPGAAEAIAEELIALAANVREDLTPFAEALLAVDKVRLGAIVERVTVLDHAAESGRVALDEVPALRFLAPLQRETIFDRASALVRRTAELAAIEQRPAVVDRVAFDREVRALVRSVSLAPLAMSFSDEMASADPSEYAAFGFVKQLEWIDTDADFARDCIVHYVIARAARIKWTESETVPEFELHAYEEDLKARWKLASRRQAARTYGSPTAQGQELLTEVLSGDSTLQNQAMPKAITCGSYHALADFADSSEPQIGWHPEFKSRAAARPSGGSGTP
jgi:hypothetical protein